MTSFIVASGPIRFGSEEQGLDDIDIAGGEVFGAPDSNPRPHHPPPPHVDADPWPTTVPHIPQVPEMQTAAQAQLEEPEATRDEDRQIDEPEEEEEELPQGISDPQLALDLQYQAIGVPLTDAAEGLDDHAMPKVLFTNELVDSPQEPTHPELQDREEDGDANQEVGQGPEGAVVEVCDTLTAVVGSKPALEMSDVQASNPPFMNPTFEDIIETDSESDDVDFSATVKPTAGKHAKASASFEAGRRKLEEFKRKKQEAMARRKFGTSTSDDLSHDASDSTSKDNQQLKPVPLRRGLAAYSAELEEMSSKLEASEKAKESALQDLDRVLRQLETVDAERSALHREKAVLVGEIVALKNSPLESQTQMEQAIDQLKRQLDSERLARAELSTVNEKLISELSRIKTEHQMVVTELDELREEVSNSRGNIESLKEMLAESDKERQKLESLWQEAEASTKRSPTAGSMSEPSVSDSELQRRLAKAENAVEKERQAVATLEKKLREAESALEDGRFAVERAMELQKRCDMAEEELSRLRQQEPSSNQYLQEVASDLRAQCDAAARTISRLMEENQVLTDRLNEQGSQLHRLQTQTLGSSSVSHQRNQGIQNMDNTAVDSSAREEKTSNAENRPRYSWWGWLAGADLAEGSRG